jgi:ketopantoate reductase
VEKHKQIVTLFYSSSTMRVCIVGGGIVGLSSALYLARKAEEARQLGVRGGDADLNVSGNILYYSWVHHYRTMLYDSLPVLHCELLA